MLSEAKFPYTGPMYGPNTPYPQTRNRSTVKGIKRAMIRMRYLAQPLGEETDDFGLALQAALADWQHYEGITPARGHYGRGSWIGLRHARVTEGPNRGQYAMDSLALRYVRQDALVRVHPIALGSNVTVTVCQGNHPTAGLLGNWALDFCCRGGSKVVAVEDAKIVKLSGRDPALGANQLIGIYGWSIHYETANGYRFYSTHYGDREALRVGQLVQAGELLGEVGWWPGDPGRSHLHLGVTSPKGYADAKARMALIAAAPRVLA